MNRRILILLTVLVGAAVAAALYHLDNARLSSYGSILAAAGSILAVIWFTGSLWYQSQQLREQRSYFLAEFRHLREDGRRNALMLAREILNAAETKALSLNSELTSLSDLPTKYIGFIEFGDILKSDDPVAVQTAIQSWLRKEGPALTLMKGLKSAAEVYFLAIGKEDVDYSKEPDEFIFVYGPQLWSLPFFESFQATATMLSEFMVRLEPGRKAVLIASYAVMAKTAPTEILKMDRIREDINPTTILDIREPVSVFCAIGKQDGSSSEPRLPGRYRL
jgi:hypothetical protein